jgi:hypothetical protein
MIRRHLDGNVLTWQVGALGPLDLPFTGHAYRAPSGEVVWVDPPSIAGVEEELLALGKPAHILVTFRDHDRAVPELLAKFGATFWAPRGTPEGSVPAGQAYDEQTALPAGLKAVSMPAMGYGEHALVGEAYGQRFAFVGDAVFSFEGTRFPWIAQKLAFCAPSGPIRMKKSYRGGDTAQAPADLRKLIAERPEILFLSHGWPVTDGQKWLEGCLR